LTRTLQKPYFAKRLPPQQAAVYLRALISLATLTPITIQVSGVATHPEDDLVLATALSASADYLVTRDRQLLNLGSYQRLAILAPTAFLGILHPQP
jgi:predicted nucleic acid-binding protein